MNSDLDSLVRRYANASNAELREAQSLGSEAYTADAWRVIQEEVRRRGIRLGRRERRRLVRARIRDHRASWTPGLAVGIIPATVATAFAFQRMLHAGMLRGPRGGGLGVIIGLFLLVWFGIALLVDLPLWLRNRSSRRRE